MAQITTLKDNEGNKLYPITSIKAVFDSEGVDLETILDNTLMQVPGKVLSSNDYTNEDKNKLAALPTNAELTERFGTAKLLLFVDLWTACYDCQYDNTKEKPFRCNTVDLTYAEAIAVYNAPRLSYNNVPGLARLIGDIPTVILASAAANGVSVDLNNAFRTTSFKVIRVSSDNQTTFFKSIVGAFYGCTNLETVLGVLECNTSPAVTNAFARCFALKDIKIKGLNVNISFADSPLLSFESLQYIVCEAANNTSTIVITVHADVYAKLTGDLTNDAAALVPPPEMNYWVNLLSVAAEHNIQFATT